MDGSLESERARVPPKRLYEIWPGKNRFFFNGRIMLGPREDYKQFRITLLMLVILQITFVLVICPYLWFEVNIVIPALSLQLFILSFLFMALTMTTNPGIIPRKEVFQALGEIPEVFCNQTDSSRKFCKTCNIYKPPRSSHCRKCDNCVELYDHHCPFINSCIGKNNYKYFISMVISLTLLGGTNIAGLVIFIFFDSNNKRTVRSRKIYIVTNNDTILISVAVLLIISITILTVFVLLLCVFHMKISFTGETTKEFRLNLEGSESCGWNRDKDWFHPRLVINSL